MAKLVVEALADGGVDEIIRNCVGPLRGRVGLPTAYQLEGDDGALIVFAGEGFAYDAQGRPTAGRATSCTLFRDGVAVAEVRDFKAGAERLGGAVDFTSFFAVFGDLTFGGTDASDVIATGAGDDVLNGRGGDDDMQGGDGNDTAFGGAGNDRFNFEAGRDDVHGGAGRDMLDVGGVGSGAVLSLTKAGYQRLGDGDFVRLDRVEDLLGTQFGDRFRGDGQGNDFCGFAGDDTLSGHGGSDTLEGGLGQDLLRGGDGRDFASYRDAEGPVSVNLKVDGPQETGGDGRDQLEDIEGLIGSGSADRLEGDGKANTLIGGFGRDTLIGDGGADTLDGGAGEDRLIGGGGADRYLFPGSERGDSDTIVGMSEDDKINLKTMDANSLTPGNDAFIYGGERPGFTGVAGELIWSYVGSTEQPPPIVVLFDLDGDRQADFRIVLEAPDGLLSRGDFVL